MPYRNTFLLLFAISLYTSCSNEKQPTLFTQLSPATSGIHFKNIITEALTDSSLILEFAYMGGGVGIGDFNNDGLKDIYFSGNQVSSRLYINKGNNQFEDITEKAGVGTNIWATGVSIVDINADGYDDIYVCAFGKNLTTRAKNLLFINQKDLTFREEAELYGLADSSYSTQATFFDYDKDGDLDMYLTNYMLNGPNANTIFPRNLTGTSPANDRLYRNDGIANGSDHPHFTDVTLEAGIKEDGYGLGVVVSDFNNDNWPDIYVSDDFLSNDFLWINNQDGTFTNTIAASLKHQSYSGMGADVADINNDALPDIATMDMMPETNERKKVTFSFMSYERYQMERNMHYEPEFMRNMLHLHNGTRASGNKSIPFFSEIGQLAGISETDWSWSVLMADFDNDGYKDMHVTNGIGRDFINADFVQFTTTVAGMQDEAARKQIIKEKLASLEHVRLKNYFFLNNTDLTFRNVADSVGMGTISMSNGAAWADLDNDGDLDLVINNINQEAFVYINNARQQPVANHYLQLELQGDSLNRKGIGCKIFVYTKNGVQLQEQMPVRGYLSTMDTKITFGIGRETTVDSVHVLWPDNKMNRLYQVPADTLLIINKQDAATYYDVPAEQTPPLFQDVTGRYGLQYRHKETEFNDFAVQRLLPQKYSQLGPFITTGDVNGDGLEDFFVGGGFNASGYCFIQQPNGSFVAKPLHGPGKMQEDMDCLLFDADGDNDKDLLITCGDVRYEENAPWYVPRLYRNDGKGNFTEDVNAIPESVKTIAGCVTTADIDGDGDLDLFIGGRVSKQFPLAPKSFILINNQGVFTNSTASVCPALQEAGMITAAVWTDFNNDQTPDLIVAGEWMPVRFFANRSGKLEEVTDQTGLTGIKGMWRSLVAADIDKDGDIDIVAGNFGLNCNYKTSPTYPMKLYAKDIDNNGSIDPVMFYHIKTDNGDRKLFPAIGKDMLTSQVPALKKKFVHHREFVAMGATDIFADRNNLLELTCEETATCLFENKGNGQFVKHVLPVEAQFAPVNALLCEDLDGDGNLDLLLAGNEYQMEVMAGRQDALYGLFLKGDGKLGFTPVRTVESGFLIDGDVKSMKLLDAGKRGKMVLVAVNDDSLRVFRIIK